MQSSITTQKYHCSSPIRFESWSRKEEVIVFITFTALSFSGVQEILKEISRSLLLCYKTTETKILPHRYLFWSKYYNMVYQSKVTFMFAFTDLIKTHVGYGILSLIRFISSAHYIMNSYKNYLTEINIPVPGLTVVSIAYFLLIKFSFHL